MAVKIHQTCLFWLEFGLESLGMSQNVALLLRKLYKLYKLIIVQNKNS